jgi:hypothetical protein
MRGAPVSRQRHLRRELEQALGECPLGRLRGRRQGGLNRRGGGHRSLVDPVALPGGRRDALGARLAQDARDPRVRVLDVVHRVVLRLLPCELQVEVDGGLVAALEQEEARGVGPDVVDQLVEGDEGALPLRHLRPLPALDEVDHLNDLRLEPIRVLSKGADRRAHPRDVPVVVGAEHVDQPIRAPLELVVVVGDVRGEICRLAVGPDQHAVLVVPEGRRSQPYRTLALVDVPMVAKRGHRGLQAAPLVHRPLR